MRYPIALMHVGDGCYDTQVPDVPNFVAHGSDVDDALESTEKELELYFCKLREQGLPIPLATNISHHKNKLELAGVTWALIDLDINPYLGEQVRFNASLPEGLLEQIDAVVEEKKDKYRTRSNFLKIAAIRELEKA